MVQFPMPVHVQACCPFSAHKTKLPHLLPASRLQYPENPLRMIGCMQPSLAFIFFLAGTYISSICKFEIQQIPKSLRKYFWPAINFIRAGIHTTDFFIHLCFLFQ